MNEYILEQIEDIEDEQERERAYMYTMNSTEKESYIRRVQG